jgi:hypothetical protein
MLDFIEPNKNARNKIGYPKKKQNVQYSYKNHQEAAIILIALVALTVPVSPATEYATFHSTVLTCLIL